ncbi:MAG: hypothetical protein ACRBK7_22555 [Acidimicrobiales bacterium]
MSLQLTHPVTAVVSLLPGIESDRRPTDEALDLIAATPTLIPLAVDSNGIDGDQIYWADLGSHDFQEWQLVYSIEAAVDAGTIGQYFSTSIDILDEPIPVESLEPTGFIFHMARCGSSLVSRALARSPRHLVLSQPTVLRDGIWSLMTGRWAHEPGTDERSVTMFRNLLGYLLRPRSPLAEAAFIKFFSENVVFLDFVRAAFPETPCLFLHRDPIEVLASVSETSTGMLLARGTPRGAMMAGLQPGEDEAMSDTELIARCFGRYFDVVLGSDPAGLTTLDYRHLRPQNFAAIIDDAFGYQLPEADLDAVLDQFGLYSKARPGAAIPHRDDTARKQSAVPEEDKEVLRAVLGEALDRLEHLGWNPPGGGANLGKAARC